MKKLLSVFDRLNIHFLTIIFILISIILGKIKLVFIYYLIAIIHELFHLIACKIFKVKIINFNILPLGVSMQVDNIDNIFSLKQTIIYLAGPISVFFDLFVSYYLFKINTISELTYFYIKDISIAMAICNILPIYPLDGYKIMKSFFQLFIPYKKTLKISIISSSIYFLIFILINIISSQLTITIFLFLEQIKNISNYKALYKKFLIQKTLNKKMKKYKMIKNYQMYKDVNNYKIEKSKILDDCDIATIELKHYI